MTQKIYVVDGRQFRTKNDYNRAMHDKEIIDRLRVQAQKYDVAELTRLKRDIHSGKYKFFTLLGLDFADEVEEMITRLKNGGKGRTGRHEGILRIEERKLQSGAESGNEKNYKSKDNRENNRSSEKRSSKSEKEILLDDYVKEELRKQEKRRRYFMLTAGIIAVFCLGYFGMYSYFDYKTRSTYEELSALKEQPVITSPVQKDTEPVIHYTQNETPEAREVLDEYKNLINKNKKLIGWVKIDDTNIDYPVMQTSDNEYYLDHNLNQEYDKNGSIFMDKDCDVLKPSTNYILYGHHMKSGKMFGGLHLYSNKSYYEKHKYIEFDTIYEKGVFEIMYVFRSKVYSEEEIVFKYYQFIDAVSEQEFDSNMREMAALSMYDTGVTARYGDQLLTLSTCDYQEKDGRFVVVAKKVTKE